MSQGTRSKSNASLKTHDELTAMDREELLQYSIMVTGLCDKLLDIEKRMEALESEKLIQQKVNKLLKDRADKMEARIVQTETTVTNNSQYLRRRQLEVSNVPEEIADKSLKKQMSELLSVTGQEVNEDDIAVIHRLKNKSTVIMELNNRTIRNGVLINRKNLARQKEKKMVKDMGLDRCFINESLCPAYHKLFYVCRRLKADGHMTDCWFFGGKLMVTVNNGKRLKIEHISDTHELASADKIAEYLTPKKR